MKAFVTVTQQQFDISAEQGVPAGDVLTQSVEFGNFIKGKDGSVIYNGSGVPANILGVNGDFYIDNVAPNNYYEKISGSWVLQGHFQGAQGEYTVITIGENGNWYIDGADSGQRAIGIDGYTPIIGENNNWWINGVDTGKRAVGIDGVGISNWELLSTIGEVKTYRITFTDSTTFEYSITDGTDGNDGREVLIQNNGTYIQWQYEGDETWTNIVALTALKGDSGANIELQKSITHIQWRVVGDTNWIDLIALEDLKGIEGRGIVSIIKTSTVGLVDTYTITYSDSTTSTFDITNGTGAYEIYLAGGGTLSEVDFNASITDIPAHIADATKHIDTTTAEFSGTIDETNDKLTIWDNSLLKWIRYSFTSLKTFIGTYFLNLDQTTPQTIQGNVNINGNLNAVTTNVNQSTLPSVNASQDAAILQDGSLFTGTDYVMPTNNVAVKFVASAAHTMGDFTVRVKSSATLTSTIATLTGYLYSDNAGIPSTLLATGNAIRHGSITTSYQELSLGTQFNLVAGTTYWLVIRWSSAPTGGNIIFDSNTDTSGGATSANATSWTLTNVRLRYRLRGRTFYGINSFSTNNYGVYAKSTNSFGVYGVSTNSYGGYFVSTNSIGVYGSSTNYIGVRGESTNSYGVIGVSTNNFGVYGSSTNSIGVYGSTTNNYGVYGSSTNSIGVYGSSTNNCAGYFRRNTATPTNAVPVVEIIQDHASDTNSVLDIKQDGTGEIVRFFDSGVEVASIEKGGLGIYKKGVIIGDNTDVASAANEFAIRGRKGINGNIGFSVTEMCMPTDVGTWNWVEIVRNEWIIP